ncbi:RWD domain-containing protein 1 [Smittium mucronatum]|uniref:RWD domain-containing protein 1 n=1 Tax=Smittium mucronatum TaxID=133383 RepID=A0A1R0GYB7_9FUNG|nr:RWD domain-containing protein 1 [Smittium mucronatum]
MKAILFLKITYTENYPDEPPNFNIETDEVSDLDESDISSLTTSLDQVIEETLGMAMVFSMASTLKESLNDLIVRKEEQQITLERLRIEKEIELEQQKFVGTKVTPELFHQWAAKFKLEMEKSAESQEQKRLDEKKGKLTGRELFEQDKSLALSDDKFVQDGDISVDVSSFDNTS